MAKKECQNTSTESGYIALSSVLVIGAVVIIISTVAALLSIDEAQLGLSHARREAAQALVESCTEEALLKYNKNGGVPSTLTQPEGTCSISGVSLGAGTISFTITTTLNTYTATRTISATRAGLVSITSWLEP